MKTQTLCALGVACVTLGLAFSGIWRPYPDKWLWKDSKEWFQNMFYVWTGAAVLYYPVIFGIQAALKDKEAFDLGGAKTKNSINFIFWWETGLAIFSILGAYYVVPAVLKPLLEGTPVAQAVCGRGEPLDFQISGFWTFLFCASKLFEFGDTLFVVLRKKQLILLQHYHHLATMVYCWGCCLYITPEHNNSISMFAAMNLCVHSVMYTWYAATRTGWRSPKSLMMMVTLLQLVQMVGGVSIILTTVLNDCLDPLSYYGLVMYFSYLVLFAQLFYNNYIKPRDKKKKSSKQQ